jgi:hypothetical protein
MRPRPVHQSKLTGISVLSSRVVDSTPNHFRWCNVFLKFFMPSASESQRVAIPAYFPAYKRQEIVHFSMRSGNDDAPKCD